MGISSWVEGRGAGTGDLCLGMGRIYFYLMLGTYECTGISRSPQFCTILVGPTIPRCMILLNSRDSG